ncbi:MAG TPA: hypothetical protein VHV08_00925, partial [Pirellulales bacterium]|nr:hypothetical protein [Pirellulales bacterium]
DRNPSSFGAASIATSLGYADNTFEPSRRAVSAARSRRFGSLTKFLAARDVPRCICRDERSRFSKAECDAKLPSYLGFLASSKITGELLSIACGLPKNTTAQAALRLARNRQAAKECDCA